MTRFFKYNVAVSVAEEDKEVAIQIISELKKIGIRYYYYEENAAKNWGEHIIELTTRIFGKESRYILMITSRIFADKYWANLEKLVALAAIPRKRTRILQLRLDDTLIEGIPKHMVYRDWQNNPGEIARFIKTKIRTEQQTERSIAVGILLIVIAGIMTLLIYMRQNTSVIDNGYISSPQSLMSDPAIMQQSEAKKKKQLISNELPGVKEDVSRETTTPKDIQRMLITGSPLASFYISSTEVTIAEYRKYCEGTNTPFPPQSPDVEDDAPVSNVSWYEAMEYCKSKSGRLPTEKEWEYAAGAGLPVKYSGGNNAGSIAVYKRAKQKSVASLAGNGFGLYDMTGNVAEWCADWSDSSRQRKIVKGGAYNSHISPVNELLITSRSMANPGERQPTIGFRVAWSKQ